MSEEDRNRQGSGAGSGTDQPADRIRVEDVDEGAAVAAGRGAWATAIRIGDIRIDLRLLPLVVLLLAVVSVLAYLLLRPACKKVMSGEFNVAVAKFQVIGEERIPEHLRDVAQGFYLRFQSELESLAEQIDVIVEISEPQCTGQISGETSEDRAAQAEKLAQDIRADVVIYGTIEVQDSALHISPEFFVNVDSFREAEEVVGQYRMSAQIEADSETGTRPKREIYQELSARSKALALLVIGLSYYANDDYAEALTFFEEAEKIEAWQEGKEVLYVLLGTSALKLELVEQAEWYCDEARRLNKEYSRAFICAGSVLYQQALGTAKSYDEVDADLLEESIATFQDALEAEERPPRSDVPTKVNLALGQAYLIKAQMGEGDYLDQAVKALEAVVYDYGSGQEQNDRVRELASHAYAHLGLIQRMTGDYRTAIPYYEQAVKLTHTRERKAIYAAFLGDICKELGDREQAIEWYKQAVEIAPQGSEHRGEYERRLEEILLDPGRDS